MSPLPLLFVEGWLVVLFRLLEGSNWDFCYL